MLKKLSRTILLQAVNTALPFITMPYYVLKLGVEGYGKIGVAIAVIQYFLMLVDFGFTLPSIRSVARSECKKLDASSIFSNTTVVKFLIFLIGVALITAMCFVFSVNTELWVLISIGYCLVLGQLLTPSWIFVGRHSGDLLLIFTIIPRALVIPLIIFFVNKESDINIAMLLQVFPSLITAFITIYWVITMGWMDFIRPKYSLIRIQINQAWPLFISSAASSLYGSSTPIILNSLGGAYSAGIFLIADKIRQGLLAILPPLSLVFYPKMVQEFSANIQKAYFQVKRIAIFMMVGMTMISIFVFCFSGDIIVLIFGDNAIESVTVLRIMSISVIFACFNTILGSYIMLSLGAEKIYSKILLLAGCIHIGIVSILVLFFGSNGAAFGILFTEFLMALLMIMTLIKSNRFFDKCNYQDSIIRNILKARLLPDY